MTGKQKCKILKEIRRQIAEANEIRYVVEECTHKGKCKGTCPRCEWEVRELEKALEKRRLSGKKIALAGISAGLIASTATACSPVEVIEKAVNRLIGNEVQGMMEVEGDIPYTPDTQWTEKNVDIPGELVKETAVGEVVADVDGLLAPPETAEEEYVLEGDVAFPDREEES